MVLTQGNLPPEAVSLNQWPVFNYSSLLTSGSNYHKHASPPAAMSFLKGAYLWGSVLFSLTPIHKSYSLALFIEVFEIR